MKTTQLPQNAGRRRSDSDRGAILMVVLIVMIALLGLGMTGLFLTSGSIQMNTNINLRNQEITVQTRRNSLLPYLDVNASYNLLGLGGALRPTFANIFQNDYPNISYGVSLSLPIRNRSVQADAARALIEQRQLQMKLQQAKNQAVWDVSKAVSAVQQAKSQLDAALKLARVSRQVLDMQQQKFTLASATVEEVINAQRDLANAEGNVVKDRATYAKALIQFEQATGTLLDRNNIDLSEAVQGEVHRVPNIPGTHEPTN